MSAQSLLDQLARRGAHSLGFDRRAACFNECTPSGMLTR